MTGWVKLHRTILDNPLWQEQPFSRGQAWVDMILLANNQTGTIHRRGIRITVRRGEIGYSLRELGRRWGWSLGKVQRFLDELKTDTQIDTRNDTENVSVTSLIRLINYEKYQSRDTKNDTKTGTETGTEQEGKEKTLNILSDFFSKLWEAYPKKDGRKSAERHYTATVKNETDMERINLALGHYLNHIEVNKLDLKYIKNGSTWFNNWQDWEVIEDGK